MASSAHDEGEAAATRWVIGQGYEPQELPELYGRRPDVYGERRAGEGKVAKMVVEVETCESLDEEQAREQMTAFANWAAEHPTRRLVLFVPEQCLSEAKRKLHAYKEFQGF